LRTSSISVIASDETDQLTAQSTMVQMRFPLHELLAD
jgi:hypothetical protein